MDTIGYDSRLVEVVTDYARFHNRDRTWNMCLIAAEEFEVDPEEVLYDVDLLYQEEFGDIFE